jgi:hypothetical protein
MADDYVREMRRVQPEGPYLLGGVCAGSVVAAEMGARLQLAGARVSPLVLIDPPAVAPGSVRPWRRTVRSSWVGMKRAWPWLSWLSPADRRMIATWHRDPAGQVVRGVRLGLEFQLALLNHRAWEYDGPVIVLRSAEMKNRGSANGRPFAEHLTGDVEWLDFGGRHGDLHSTVNHDFDRQLDRAITIARGAMRA